MWFIIGSIVVIGLLALVLCVRHRIVMDTVTDFAESGIYAYRKHGLWHVGVDRGR